MDNEHELEPLVKEFAELLRGRVDRDEFDHLDVALFVGEQYSALFDCVEMAARYRVPVPADLVQRTREAERASDGRRQPVSDYMEEELDRLVIAEP